MARFIEEKPIGYTAGYAKEVPDPTPVEIPFDCKLPESLHDQVKRLCNSHFAQLQLDQETESFEEADDFDVGDDYDPTSPYEEEFYGRWDEDIIGNKHSSAVDASQSVVGGSEGIQPSDELNTQNNPVSVSQNGDVEI